MLLFDFPCHFPDTLRHANIQYYHEAPLCACFLSSLAAGCVHVKTPRGTRVASHLAEGNRITTTIHTSLHTISRLTKLTVTNTRVASTMTCILKRFAFSHYFQRLQRYLAKFRRVFLLLVTQTSF